jgi:hypothetical protein
LIRPEKGGRLVTYAGRDLWAYLVILVVMVVILLNAEGCAELILQSKLVVREQSISCCHTEYYLPEDLRQDDTIMVILP